MMASEEEPNFDFSVLEKMPEARKLWQPLMLILHYL
jgi:hypothetical protein